MDNPGSSGNNYSPRSHSSPSYRQYQQFPQTMTHLDFITFKATNQAQVPFQNQQQPIEEIIKYNLPFQPFSQHESQSNFTANHHLAMHEKITNTNNDDNQSNNDPKTKKFFTFSKQKRNNLDRKKRLNAEIQRPICPKNPLMIFSELYNGVPINVNLTQNESGVFHTACFEVDGQVYVGKHISKVQAKQKACEDFLRKMLENKMIETLGKKNNSAGLKKDDSKNDTNAKLRGPPQDDFPWSLFASLAMHDLINKWKIVTFDEEATVDPKVYSGMKTFPRNPENYNPVHLLHLMAPSVNFSDRTISFSNPSYFEVSCHLNDMTFKGKGPTKKAAKRESSIAAIKHFWNYDFHSLSV